MHSYDCIGAVFIGRAGNSEYVRCTDTLAVIDGRHNWLCR